MSKFKKVKQFVFMTLVTVATVTAGTTSLARASDADDAYRHCLFRCENYIVNIFQKIQAIITEDGLNEYAKSKISAPGFTESVYGPPPQTLLDEHCPQICKEYSNAYNK